MKMSFRFFYYLLCFAIAGLFSFPAIAQQQTENTERKTSAKPVDEEQEFSHFCRISASIGPSFKTAQPKNELAKKVSRGTAYSFQVTFTPENGFGGGVYFDSWTSREGKVLVEQGQSVDSYNQSDKMFFVGPCLSYRVGKRKILFNTDLFVGYYGFKSKVKRNYETPSEMKGKTIGAGLATSLDFRLFQSVCVGVGMSYITGSLTSVEINGKATELSDDDRQSLSRFGGNVGLKIWL